MAVHDHRELNGTMAATAAPLRRILVANRGEVAMRLLRGIAASGATGVVGYPDDDAETLAVLTAAEAVRLPGVGPAAYLDTDALVTAAIATRCDAIHPGYGFLSEDPGLAEACADAGMVFIGPTPDVLRLFGDKSKARELARSLDVPVLRGTPGPVDLAGAHKFRSKLGADVTLVVKAVAGGGGRGMRVVNTAEELDSVWERCRSEAAAAFGNDALMVEEFAPNARHIEVQVIGDGTGAVVQVGERECSLQRRNQKIVEIAPAIHLDDELRSQIHEAAIVMASHVGYRGLGTFEFLVREGGLAFLEANPRLQVEHTVTEEVTGLDLVRISVDIASGATLEELHLTQDQVPTPRGYSVQARVNMETLSRDGIVVPSGGRLDVFEAPSGPGVRVDTFGYPGYVTSPRYDSLLMKVIATDRSYGDAISRLDRALAEFEVSGVETNTAFLRALLSHRDVSAGTFDTRFVDEHMAELVEAAASFAPRGPRAEMDTTPAGAAPTRERIEDLPNAIRSQLQGMVVEILVEEGSAVAEGTPVVVIEAMKMEHVIVADRSGAVTRVFVQDGEVVGEGDPLVDIDPMDVELVPDEGGVEIDLDELRPDLLEVLERKSFIDDANRPGPVSKRHARNKRTAWENVQDLCDEGSFQEYGALVVAAQRSTRSFEELVEKTPRDGIVTGIGKVNGESCVVMAYDYTVLAGTQGYWGHKKKDRMLEVALEARTPVIIFTEGGGGRAGDTDPELLSVSALETPTLAHLAHLSGRVPTIAINSGYCFAGNAVLLGLCDVVIGTEDSNIGIGGPSMIAEAGLGEMHATEIGPHEVHVRNGVIDISASDEREAVAIAKKYLSFFQGPADEWTAADQRLLRTVIPENRMRAYDVRRVIDLIADTDSTLELRPAFGETMVTALARIEGRPVGIIANNPMCLAGAVDTDGSDKAARFMQLCDAYGLPIIALCDTPGIMVGPDAERSGLVRHASRTIAAGANVSVPLLTLVLRKAYGIGAQVMAAGHFRAPLSIVSWPTGEFGPMGLEGTIRLSHGRELEAIEDEAERDRRFRELVDELYAKSKALGVATAWEIDDVIDPATTRSWLVALLDAGEVGRPERTYPYLDTW